MEPTLVKQEEGYGCTMYGVQEVKENYSIVLPVPMEMTLAHTLKMLE